MKFAEVIQRAIEIAGPTGTITFDQVNELVPLDLEPEVIEALFSALSAEGIQIVEENKSGAASGRPARIAIRLPSVTIGLLPRRAQSLID